MGDTTTLTVPGTTITLNSPDLATLLHDITALSPHPRNPRNGDTDAITDSIRVNGLYRPLYAQRSTGHIVAGNHTYAALLEAGATHAPVVWLDITDNAADRILLADNRTADLGRYDDALLVDLLASLNETEGALLGTGYTLDDLGDLAAFIAGPPDLDDLASQWDGSGLRYRLVIAITDRDLADRWQHHRADHRDDDTALAALLP